MNSWKDGDSSMVTPLYHLPIDFFSVYLDVVHCSGGQKAASPEAGVEVYLRRGSFLRQLSGTIQQ